MKKNINKNESITGTSKDKCGVNLTIIPESELKKNRSDAYDYVI